MQIALFSTLGGGGVGMVTNNLILGLMKKHDVQIELFLIDNRLKHTFTSSNRIKYRYTPKIGTPYLARIRAILDLSFKKPIVDLVHCHYASNAAFLRRYKGNLVLTMHGFSRPEVESHLIDKFAYFFEKSSYHLLPKNTFIVTISNYSKEILKHRYGLHAKVIYNGIDCNFFRPTSNRNIVKKAMHLEQKKVILYVGRLHPQKDPITLVKAYHEVSKEVKDTILVIVGDGPLKEQITELASSYGLPINIMKNISRAKLLSLYQCADLFVLTSFPGEPFGISLVEAMACACPCVANTSGASIEILGRKDLLVEPKNPKALADLMVNLLQNPEISEKLSEFLYTRANDLFTLERMANEYYALYTRVINK